jgi:hypothetical protein
MRIIKISAVTIFTKNMKKSCCFYLRMPAFEITYGGSSSEFTTFKISDWPKMYLNIELSLKHAPCHFGRIIFHTDDVDSLYKYLKNDKIISKLGKFETKPKDAKWGERFFHMRDPDNYQLAFATPL